MIRQWGLETLRSGEGVIDIGGDPGFAAAELLRSGVPVTVVDPGFGQAGKANSWTSQVLQDPSNWQRVPAGKVPFRLIRRPFNQDFVDEPEHASLLGGASALVSLYPDEATDFTLFFSASRGMRTAVIPCNECAQYFPKHDPTYEGFVNFLLERDMHQVSCLGGQRAALRRDWLSGSPFCQVVLQRTPPCDWAAALPRGPGGHWPPPEANPARHAAARQGLWR
ncbi:unnamed protein product [Prorocentrum cordatum]|nr:unnamed protein product [Polarella glacialis]